MQRQRKKTPFPRQESEPRAVLITIEHDQTPSKTKTHLRDGGVEPLCGPQQRRDQGCGVDLLTVSGGSSSSSSVCGCEGGFPLLFRRRRQRRIAIFEVLRRRRHRRRHDREGHGDEGGVRELGRGPDFRYRDGGGKRRRWRVFPSRLRFSLSALSSALAAGPADALAPQRRVQGETEGVSRLGRTRGRRVRQLRVHAGAEHGGSRVDGRGRDWDPPLLGAAPASGGGGGGRGA